jgi:hypothetical protein
MEQRSTEQRLSALESEVAALKVFKQEQENRDLSLLARIDGFIDDLRRVERVQMKAFDHLSAEVRDIKATQTAISAEVRDIKVEVRDIKVTQTVIVDAVKDHKQAIEQLAIGQQQILALLTGDPRRND